MKKSSFPSRLHTGNPPPAVETCQVPAPEGNGRTYTSDLPDSLEAYAIHRPSGENRLEPGTVSAPNGVTRLCSAVSRIQSSLFLLPRAGMTLQEMNRPSFDQSSGKRASSLSPKGSSLPPSSGLIQRSPRPDLAFRSEE